MAKSVRRPADQWPVLFVGYGRQRVGKTTLLNTIAQALRQRGAEFKIWNADQLNTTYNLNLFHSDVLNPPSTDFEDIKVWLEDRIQDQIDGQYDAVLDITGGESPLSRIVQEVPIVKTLESQGIRVVVAHVIGPEQADVDYLKRVMANSLFTPEATLIILNGGLVMPGRSVTGAFAAIYEHPVIVDALAKNAVIVQMPALGCMSQVTDRGLTFAETVAGKTKGKLPRMSFLDQARVATWWENAVPRFIEQIPPHWLPAIPRPKQTEPADPGQLTNV